MQTATDALVLRDRKLDEQDRLLTLLSAEQVRSTHGEMAIRPAGIAIPSSFSLRHRAQMSPPPALSPHSTICSGR